jgi:acetyl-CoA C-acetyltransferase
VRQRTLQRPQTHCAESLRCAPQSILLGTAEVVVAGGMESMSNAPYYLPRVRQGLRLGHAEVVDAVIKDGLWDPYGNAHMGTCAELCSR